MNVINTGDFLQQGFVCPESKAVGAKRHKNTWDMQGVVRETWCEVGASGSRRRGDISHSSHELHMLSGISRAAGLLLERKMRWMMREIIDGDELMGLFIAVHHDATPLLVKFGQLQGQLENFARYLVFEDGFWRQYDFDNYKLVKGHTAKTHSGIVELLAVHAGIHFHKEGMYQSRAFFRKPHHRRKG